MFLCLELNPARNRVEKRARPSQSVGDPSEVTFQGHQPQLLPTPPARPQPELPATTTAGSDIGTYNNNRLRSLSDEDRLWILQNAFRPKEEYGEKCSMHGYPGCVF